MTDDAARQREKVQKIYSGESDYYITSTPHAKSSSLSRAAEVLKPEGGVHLDVATGAGHTAFQIAPMCDWVIPSDLTKSMLGSTRKNGAEKGVSNARLLCTDAESIALRDASVDSVSVRIAPHHFSDVQGAIGEMGRVLKPGGRLVYIDNIAPEEPPEAKGYNDFEALRDPSHNRCDSLPVLVEMFEEAGLEILYTETIRKRMDFEEWVDRPHLTGGDREGLKRFLAEPSPAIRHWMNPREEGGKLYFDEIEGVILARRG
ncbi:MAG: methyltransferase domain-containing protein [Nitrospinota bacterium]|nr:methyltransferase domain-containing protein [Nitrospinota bacterium]